MRVPLALAHLVMKTHKTGESEVKYYFIVEL